MNIAFNMDCLEYMKTLKDNEFDLIIADPPYGDCDGSWNTPQEVRGGGTRFGQWFKRYRNLQADCTTTADLHDIAIRQSGGGKTRSVSGLKAEHGQDDTTGVG